MQFFIILLLLGSCAMLTRSRPSRLEETNDSETAEVEYEANDDSAADDYLREEQEPTMEEVQQKIGRREDVQQESREQGDARDSDVAVCQQPTQDNGYESLSDNNSGPRKERERHGITDFTGSEKDYISEKERSRNPTQQIDEAGNKAPDNFYSRSRINRPQKDVSINGRPVDTNPEYGEMLFKIKPAQTSRQQNSIAEEAGEQSRMQQYYNTMHSKNKNHESENALNYERDRRHAKNVEDSTRTPTDKEEADTTNESSENAIIRNIKKLSEQDLEELLNSLPDDKRALLKKIMDKREITKKAGAVDESSYLEGGQPDTSKLEGGYSVDSNTDSSMSTTDSGKQPENSDNLSSKSPDNESGSKGSASKSEIINNSDVKNNEPAFAREGESSNVDSKNDANINSNAEEISKNEKRETNDKDLINEKIHLDDSKISDIQFDDFPVNQDDLCSENEDWIDTKPNEPKESNTRSDTSKREISQKEPLAMQDCVKSLEESFPADNSYEDNSLDSEMAPLIRVKRTEKDHHIKKRDSSVSSDVKVHYAPRIESEDCENDEKSEFEDYGEFDRASNFIRNDQEVKSSKDTVLANRNTQRLYSQFDRSDSEFRPAILSESHKKDKMSLGSDTDSVLSGVEGVDDNLMYNSGSRGKRTIESLNDNAGKIYLNRSGRTAGPMNDAVSDNSINVSQYQDDEAFGPLPRNSEEDVSRFKRVRQV